MTGKIITREEYDRLKSAVADHEDRIREWRRPGRLYYVSQQVYDADGRLVAEHKDDGTFMAY